MMSHKNKPLRCADPAPPLMSSSEDTDPAYMPAVSYTKTRNTWQESKCADDSAVPALQTGNLPPHREGQRIPNGQVPALVLNADYQPLSYVPLSLWSWQDTVRAVFRGSVTVLSEYDVTVRSPSVRASAAVGHRAEKAHRPCDARHPALYPAKSLSEGQVHLPVLPQVSAHGPAHL